MIKEALQYIVGMSAPCIREIKGETYSDKPLERISHNPKASVIEMTTLTSLVEYIKADIDSMSGKMIVHVSSPSRVELYSQLDNERKREYLVEVNAQVPDFRYGTFIDHESFLIALQSKFIENDDRKVLTKFAGTVENGTLAKYGDDGVTQKATIKTGISSKSDAIVPNPVKLKPFRTFVEAEQPESSFLFRLREGGSGEIACALFEADGGAWKNEAVKNIKEYLEKELGGLPQFTVIS